MKIGIKVGDVMTRDFVSVTPDVNIQECARIMTKKRVGSLIILEDKKLKGLLTERDIIWAMTKKSLNDLSNVKAGDLAKKKVAIIKPSADLHEALDVMRKSKFKRLPVVAEGKVLGFLTLKDILNIEPGLFEIARNLNTFQIREEDEKLKRKSLRLNSKEANDGICEECGNFDLLSEVNDKLICESCRDRN